MPANLTTPTPSATPSILTILSADSVTIQPNNLILIMMAGFVLTNVLIFVIVSLNYCSQIKTLRRINQATKEIPNEIVAQLRRF